MTETTAPAQDRYFQPYPIRFRAWHVRDNVMLVWQCLMQTAFNRGENHLLYSTLANHADDFVTMLWTGLDDKRGRPIHEGDIVTAWSQGSKRTLEVRWRQGAGPCWILYPAWSDGQFWHLSGSPGGDGNWVDDGAEVIGNIYENPEMRPLETTP